MSWFEGFTLQTHAVVDGEINYRVGGRADGPALVLLHGFPQTHAMWHRVARMLAPHYRIVLPDLRGYGDSHKPRGADNHANYSKRRMAADVVSLVDALGIESFYLCGHDRGGRVAHRLALDHPARPLKLAVLDICPTLDMYKATSMAFASAYYHWFHLIQPYPLPENMIGGNARDYLHTKLGGWGAANLEHIEPDALLEYERCFCHPDTIHALCEDYRASATIDLEHDTASRAKGQRIACETLVLWGARGVVHKLFKPLELWQAQCSAQVSGTELPSGHYIPEELPEITARMLAQFFR